MRMLRLIATFGAMASTVGIVGTTTLLSGCGGSTCTTEAPPAVELYLTADSASSQVLCDAQVIASNNYGDVTYATGYSTEASRCRFAFAHEQPGTYTIQIHAEGYDPVLLENIEVTTGKCHVSTVQLTEALVPSNSNCHDGYEWVDDACKTPNGCTFPELERQVIPGVQGAAITYDCVSSCEALGTNQYELPEAPGRCAAIALP